MTSAAGGARVPHPEKDRSANRRTYLDNGNINGRKVILLEGDVREVAPNIERVADMHGFVVMVPPSDDDNWLLDLLFRITMAYAAMPSLLRSRSKVQKMVEAIMNYKGRPAKRAKPKPSSSASAKR
jgi:hypothetical protein